MTMYEKGNMTAPTEDEFRAARVLAERPDEFGEQAHQVCRWFRGQMFIRESAEIALCAIRDDTVPAYIASSALPGDPA